MQRQVCAVAVAAAAAEGALLRRCLHPEHLPDAVFSQPAPESSSSLQGGRGASGQRLEASTARPRSGSGVRNLVIDTKRTRAAPRRPLPMPPAARAGAPSGPTW